MKRSTEGHSTYGRRRGVCPYQIGLRVLPYRYVECLGSIRPSNAHPVLSDPAQSTSNRRKAYYYHAGAPTVLPGQPVHPRLLTHPPLRLLLGPLTAHWFDEVADRTGQIGRLLPLHCSLDYNIRTTPTPDLEYILFTILLSSAQSSRSTCSAYP